MQETQKKWVQSLGWEDPLEEEWQPVPAFLPGEPHGQRSQVGYSPWGHKESNTTERLSTHTEVNLSYIYSLKKKFTFYIIVFPAKQ